MFGYTGAGSALSPILYLTPKDTAVNSHDPSNNFQSGEEELFEQNFLFLRFGHAAVSDGLFRQGVFQPNLDCRAKR